MQNFVEFYFHGISVGGQNARAVKTRNPADVGRIPAYAYAFRFYESTTVDGPKENLSPYYYIGEELSIEKLKKSPVPSIPLDLTKCNRVVQLTTGSFRDIKDEDIVVAPF